MTHLVDVVAVVAFFACANFIVVYSWAARWWLSEAGVNVVCLTGAITGLFGLRCLALVFGDGFPGQTLLRLILFTAITGVIYWRTRLLVKAQISARDFAAEHHESTVIRAA